MHISLFLFRAPAFPRQLFPSPDLARAIFKILIPEVWVWVFYLSKCKKVSKFIWPPGNSKVMCRQLNKGRWIQSVHECPLLGWDQAENHQPRERFLGEGLSQRSNLWQIQASALLLGFCWVRILGMGKGRAMIFKGFSLQR